MGETRMRAEPAPVTLIADGWGDYELLDSGNGSKLERFGPYRFARPEPEALWRPALPQPAWDAADGTFIPGGEESGRWQFRRQLPERWQMGYRDLRFWAEPTPFRHMGVFPEQATHWDWMSGLIKQAHRPVRVLNLFGYTGIATLAAAAAGAEVTHVDASKPSLAWARENQALARLEGRPIRWLVDDALKFALREVRRGSRYDGIILDPPKFGRGPKGEIWRLEKGLPPLLDACAALLDPGALFVVLTAYAVRMSPFSLAHMLSPLVPPGGRVEAGEMGVRETGTGRVLATAIFSRWSAG